MDRPRTLARCALSLVLGAALLAGCGRTPAAVLPDEPTSTTLPTAPPTEPPAPTAAPTAPAMPAPTTPPTLEPQPAPTAVEPTAAPTEPPAAEGFGSEILFLRGGELLAFDVATRAERPIVGGVQDFAALPDGSRIALVREVDRVTDLWLVGRDGQGLTRLTSDGDDRIEATPSWAPDGLTLVYAAADTSDRYPLEWPGWAGWCVVSQVNALDLATGALRPLGAGCDPRFSPDGRRIAFASPPSQVEPALEAFGPTTANSIRLVNRQGENGWDFARAQGVDVEGSGRLVYGPAWSTDGAAIVYHRFYGNQVEVDINVTEIGGSFEGRGVPAGEGAGWLLPAQFAPDGGSFAVTEHNYSDARGFGGYDAWSLSVIRLEGSREVFMPSGPMTMRGTLAGGEPLRRAQRAAWSPDGAALAVQLPPSWRPGIPDGEPLDPTGAERPGEVWRWQPGAQPDELLITNVDFASPLAWLPPFGQP